MSKAFAPAIISAKRQKQVATIVLQRTCKEVGRSADVEILFKNEKEQAAFEETKANGFLAVTTRCTSTLVPSDLHETLLASTSHFMLVACAFLHGYGGENNWRDTVLVSIFLKETKIFGAGMVGRFISVQGGGERHSNEVGYSNVGRIPAAVVYSTVEPIKTSVGTSGFGCALCGI